MRIKIGPVVLLSDFLCCDKFDIMTRVQDIKVPTLIICGTEDIMTPPKYSEFLAAKIPGSKHVLVEGAGHSIALEKPDEVNKVIREWLGREQS
jgi:pimeloyl-ACP methyl ester carboxylesterase